MSKHDYADTVYVRAVNAGTEEGYMMVGEDPSEVSEEGLANGDKADVTVARYVLAGVGKIHYTAPRYVENPKA